MPRAQVNLYFWGGSFPQDYPFIDCSRQIHAPWRIVGTPSEDIYGVFDDDGYPTKMAGLSPGWREFLTLYITDDDPWVIDWEGSGTVTLNTNTSDLSNPASATMQSSTDTISANRLEVTFTNPNTSDHPVGSNFGAVIWITATTEGNHAKNIRVYRKSHEARLDAGEVSAPHFRDMYKQFARVRFMDPMRTNGNQQVKWEHRSLPTDHSWIGGTLRKDFYAGTATHTANDYVTASAVTADPASWTHGQMVTMKHTNVPTTKVVTGFSRAANALITAVGHGLSIGDKVFFLPLGLTGDYVTYTTGRFFTIQTAPDADTFTIDLNSSGFSSATFADGTPRVAKQVTLACGDLPAKAVFDKAGGHIYPSVEWAANDVRQFVYDEVRDALFCGLGPMSGGAGGAGGQESLLTGTPLEVILDICSEIQAEASHTIEFWLNIPHKADATWVQNFAEMCRDRHPELHFVFEFSNEVWNVGAGFGQTPWASTQGCVLWPNDVDLAFSGQIMGNNRTAWDNWYGMRFHEVMTIVDSVFTGADASRVKKAFGVWTVTFSAPYSTQRTNRFEAPLADLPSTPISLADELCIAPYFIGAGSEMSDAQYVWKLKQGGADREEALDWIDAKFRDVDGDEQTVDSYNATIFPAWKTICDANNVSLVQYEGGANLGALNALSLTASSYNSETLGVYPVPITGASAGNTGQVRLKIQSNYTPPATFVMAPKYHVKDVKGTTEANSPQSAPWTVDVICSGRSNSGLSWAANVATVTLTGHKLVTGNVVTIAGVTPSGYNGERTVASTPTADTFTFALTSDPGGSSSVHGTSTAQYVDLTGSTFANTWVGGGRLCSDRDELYYEYCADDRYGQACRDIWEGFIAAGGTYPSVYCLVGIGWGNSIWSMIKPNIFADPPPSYTYLQNFNDWRPVGRGQFTKFR